MGCCCGGCGCCQDDRRGGEPRRKRPSSRTLSNSSVGWSREQLGRGAGNRLTNPTPPDGLLALSHPAAERPAVGARVQTRSPPFAAGDSVLTDTPYGRRYL